MKRLFSLLFSILLITGGVFSSTQKIAHAQFDDIQAEAREVGQAEIEGRAVSPTNITGQASKVVQDPIGSATTVLSAIVSAPEWAARFGEAILSFNALFLTIAAGIFEFSLQVSVIEFYKLANLEMIQNLWQMTRDFANMFFIFIMLYIGIGTVLNLKNVDYRPMIIGVVLTAVAINFSMLVVKLAVDPANILALQFYNKINNASVPTTLNDAAEYFSEKAKTEIGQDITIQKSISATIVDSLRISSIYQIEGKTLTWTNIFWNTALGSFMIFGAITVLLTAAILFFFRTLVLLMLMVTGPLAFLARVIPFKKVNGYYATWWDMLFNQTIWAPVYMFLLYFAIYAMKASNLVAAVGNSENPVNLLDHVVGEGDKNIFLFYVFNIAFLGATIIAAKDFGAKGVNLASGWAADASRFVKDNLSGVSLATKYGDKFLGAVGGESYSNLKETASAYKNSMSGSALGRLALGVGGTLAAPIETANDWTNSGLGVRVLGAPSKEAEEAQKKRVGDLTKGITGEKDEKKVLRSFLRMNEADQKKIYESLSDRDKIALEEKARRNPDAGGAKVLEIINGPDGNGGLKKKLSLETQEKLEEMQKKVQDKAYEKLGKEDTKKMKEKIDFLKTDPIAEGEAQEMLKEFLKLKPEEQERYYDQLSPEGKAHFDELAKRCPGLKVPGENGEVSLESIMPKLRSKVSTENLKKADKERGRIVAGKLRTALGDNPLRSLSTDQLEAITAGDPDNLRRLGPDLIARRAADFAPYITIKHLEALIYERPTQQQRTAIADAIRSSNQTKKGVKAYLNSSSLWPSNLPPPPGPGGNPPPNPNP